MRKKNVVHMLWVYGELSLLEKIAARSFIRNGFFLNIWTYGINNIDIDGATIRNAREVLPETEIFLNKHKSYAAFSDIFRYCLLSKHGGIYVDTDVISLKHADEIPICNFLVQERSQDKGHIINGNVISYQNFEKNSLIEKAKKFALEFPKSEIEWAEIGPSLLTKLISENADHGFTIFPPEFANNYDYWDCPEIYLKKRYENPSNNSCFIHLYNEMWKRKKINKNKIYSSKTFYGRLQRNFLYDKELINASSFRQFFKFFGKEK
tara:strand:+ start:162 stop:956 length:795 start_codon:yes stop_codon:yes gene_type:complete